MSRRRLGIGIETDVQEFKPRNISFHHKLFIHEGQWHLYFKVGTFTSWYTPEFSMNPYSGWEHVCSWPLDIPFVEEATSVVLEEWFVWHRPRQIDLDALKEIGLEVCQDVAISDNKEFDRRKKWEENERREKLATVLTA